MKKCGKKINFFFCNLLQLLTFGMQLLLVDCVSESSTEQRRGGTPWLTASERGREREVSAAGTSHLVIPINFLSKAMLCNCERKRFKDTVSHIKVRCFFWLQASTMICPMFCIPILGFKSDEEGAIKFCQNTSHSEKHTDPHFFETKIRQIFLKANRD